MLSAWAEYQDFKSEIACGATSLDLVFVYRIIYPHTPCRRITYPPEQGKLELPVFGALRLKFYLKLYLKLSRL